MGNSQRSNDQQLHRRTALFDLYGTLVDVEIDESSLAFWRGVAAQLSPSEECDAERDAVSLRSQFHELCARETRRSGEGNILRYVFAELLRRAGRHASTSEVEVFAREFRRRSVKRLAIRPYARPLLSKLRAGGVRTGLVSNTEALLTWDDIDQLQIRDLFDRIVLSSDTLTRKPDPKILDLVLAQLQTAPPDAVMVGDDWETDVRAGLDAGVHVVWLDEGVASGPPGVDAATGVLRAHPDLRSCVLALEALGFLKPRATGN